MKNLTIFAMLIAFVLVSFVNAEENTVRDLQAVIDATGAEWTAGETFVSRMSTEEFQNMMGLLPGIGDERSLPEETIIDTPVRLERFETPHTPVKNQGSCGSCYSFGALAAYEGWKLQQGQTLDGSEQYFMMKAKSIGPAGGCSGWYLDASMNLLKNYGVCDERECQYRASEQNCSSSVKLSHRINSWNRTTNINTIKNALQSGPVYVGFAVYSDFRNYNGGYYQHVSGSLEGYHAVAIVGYDDKGWKVKNSWGTGWGESGYFRIAYNSNCEFGTCFGGSYWVGGAMANENDRVEIEKELPFDINPDGSIAIKVTKENPLWTMKVSVQLTILEPQGAFSGSFSLKSKGKAEQKGQLANVSSGQKVSLPGKYTVYVGENTIELNAKYTGTTGATKGKILVKITTDDAALAEETEPTTLSEMGRADIEKEIKFQIAADGSINVNIMQENPLWTMKVKVDFTILNPVGTYSATFTIKKPGKPEQTGKVENVSAGQKNTLPQTFTAYEGKNNIILTGKYTGPNVGSEGTIKLVLKSQN